MLTYHLKIILKCFKNLKIIHDILLLSPMSHHVSRSILKFRYLNIFRDMQVWLGKLELRVCRVYPSVGSSGVGSVPVTFLLQMTTGLLG